MRPKTNTDVKTALKTPENFESYGRTLNKQHNFYVDSVINENFSFHVFASFAVINMIKEHIPPSRRNYLLDGTFQVAPSDLFSQLLILSIEYQNDVS